MPWNCFCCVNSQEENQPAETPRVTKNRDYPWDIYPLKELLHATNNFHHDNKIGEGGFGSVYWGRTSKGVEIAVKRLKTMSPKAEMEFAVEVEILGRVRHRNLLGLRGFYAGGDERLIVYDFMPNHSLITHLHGQLANDCLLDWPRRLSIMIGSADGLSWDVPTLVAWGISDKYLPQSVAEEFKKANPSVVNLKLIEGAGHMPQEDWPERVVSLLLL
ncbi:hypothetical protein ACLB2K_071166 [Fragaria x ananassa]